MSRLVLLPAKGIEHPVADGHVLLLQIDIVIDLRMAQIGHAPGDNRSIPIPAGAVKREGGVRRVKNSNGIGAALDVDRSRSSILELEHVCIPPNVIDQAAAG